MQIFSLNEAPPFPPFQKVKLVPGWEFLPVHRQTSHPEGVKRILVSVHENGLKVSLESYR